MSRKDHKSRRQSTAAAVEKIIREASKPPAQEPMRVTADGRSPMVIAGLTDAYGVVGAGAREALELATRYVQDALKRGKIPRISIYLAE
jgi:hypothetical protein